MQKLSALAVAFALAFGMVGCGEKPKETKASDAVKDAAKATGDAAKAVGEEAKKAGEEVKKAAETK